MAAQLAKGSGAKLSAGHAASVEDHANAATVFSRIEVLYSSGWSTRATQLLRSAYSLGATMRERVALCQAAAQRDPGFGSLIRAADQHRDQAEWSAAEHSYWQALNLHPLHPGYRVQYAHMLKEQGKFIDAEANYRSALACGAELEDVVEHIRFVCIQQNIEFFVSSPVGLDDQSAGLRRTPNIVDLGTLAFLFLHQSHLSPQDNASLLRRCPTCEDVALELAGDNRFRMASRLFLDVLKAGRA